jgi:hypothetical protein
MSLPRLAGAADDHIVTRFGGNITATDDLAVRSPGGSLHRLISTFPAGIGDVSTMPPSAMNERLPEEPVKRRCITGAICLRWSMKPFVLSSD